MLPFLVFSLIGIKLSADFVTSLKNSVLGSSLTRKISLSIDVIHICSFISAYTHFLLLKYAPEKLEAAESV